MDFPSIDKSAKRKKYEKLFLVAKKRKKINANLGIDFSDESVVFDINVQHENIIFVH